MGERDLRVELVVPASEQALHGQCPKCIDPWDPARHCPKESLSPLRTDTGRIVLWELNRPKLEPLPTLDAGALKKEMTFLSCPTQCSTANLSHPKTEDWMWVKLISTDSTEKIATVTVTASFMARCWVWWNCHFTPLARCRCGVTATD